MKNGESTFSIEAEPYTFEFVPARCALLIIDMQRDFLEPGGFGEMLGAHKWLTHALGVSLVVFVMTTLTPGDPRRSGHVAE